MSVKFNALKHVHIQTLTETQNQRRNCILFILTVIIKYHILECDSSLMNGKYILRGDFLSRVCSGDTFFLMMLSVKENL